MTNGYLASAFDLLNVSDIDLIAQARRCCDHLRIGVYTDDRVEQLIGKPPVVPLSERLELVRHVRGVDEVVVHDDADLERLRIDHVIFKVGVRNGHQRGHRNGRHDDANVTWIEPTRHTRSHVLRAALEPAATMIADARVGIA